MSTKITNNSLYAEIDKLGAGLSSLCDLHGREYLWQGDEKYWNGRSPILFPMVGALRDDKATFEGKEYSMKQHGIARTKDWKLISKKTDSALFRFSADEETQSQYPYDFELDVEYSLKEMSLTASFTVKNNGDKDMPFCLGGHPGFFVPIEENEKFEDYSVIFPQNETVDSLGVKDRLIDDTTKIPMLSNSRVIPLKHELFYNDALVFEDLKSRSATIFSSVSGRGIKVDFDGFDFLGIWQAKDAPFLCIEPWTGMATRVTEDNCFEHKKGVRFLKPNETAEYSYTVTIL